MSGLLGAAGVVDWRDMGDLLARLALDLVMATLVIRRIYFRHYQNRDNVFTYYAFNVITFCLCLLLSKVPVGLALALFGVFGILRYRTEQIRIRDLTYLFIVIGIGVLNGVASRGASVAELLVVNGVIVAMTAVLERESANSGERATPIVYDRLELLRPGHEALLHADLRARTGLAVVRVAVERVDLLRDAAEITVVSRNDSSTVPAPTGSEP